MGIIHNRIGIIIMKDQKRKTNKQLVVEKKRPYKQPELTNLGDIRDVTMGGSIGVGDSGNGGTEEP